ELRVGAVGTLGLAAQARDPSRALAPGQAAGQRGARADASHAEGGRLPAGARHLLRAAACTERVPADLQRRAAAPCSGHADACVALSAIRTQLPRRGTRSRLPVALRDASDHEDRRVQLAWRADLRDRGTAQRDARLRVDCGRALVCVLWGSAAGTLRRTE